MSGEFEHWSGIKYDNKDTKVRNIGLLFGFTIIITYKIFFKHLTEQSFSPNNINY